MVVGTFVVKELVEQEVTGNLGAVDLVRASAACFLYVKKVGRTCNAFPIASVWVQSIVRESKVGRTGYGLKKDSSFFFVFLGQ